MSNFFNPSEEDIALNKEKLAQYKAERSSIIVFCRKYKLPIPKYNPPIDPKFAPYLSTPFTRSKDGIVFLPYPMRRSAKLRYLNPSLDRYAPLIIESDWEALLENGFDDDQIAKYIIDRYSDFDSLVLRTCSGVYDPAFRKFLLKAGYFTDWKSHGRLKADWAEILPFVVVKFLKQLKTAYRKSKGGYSTFFQAAFGRIAILTYIDYCRSIHKEDARYSTPGYSKFLDIDHNVDVETLPSISDGLTFDNELYYHILSQLITTRSYYGQV